MSTLGLGRRGDGGDERSAFPRISLAALCLRWFRAFTRVVTGRIRNSSQLVGTPRDRACAGSQSGGRRFDPGAVHQSRQRVTAISAAALLLAGTAQGRGSEKPGPESAAGCTAEIPFETSPEPLAKYAGAVWLAWPGGAAGGGVLSQDDGRRHERGFRNRWRYTISGAVAVGLPSGCELRRVTARAIAGGLVVASIDSLSILILPGDPDAQDRISQAAPACEVNRQLVSVEEIAGRWRITIEEPDWLPLTRERC